MRTRSTANKINGGTVVKVFQYEEVEQKRERTGEYGSEMYDEIVSSGNERPDGSLLPRDQLLIRQDSQGAPKRMSSAMPVDDSLLSKQNGKTSGPSPMYFMPSQTP